MPHHLWGSFSHFQMTENYTEATWNISHSNNSVSSKRKNFNFLSDGVVKMSDGGENSEECRSSVSFAFEPVGRTGTVEVTNRSMSIYMERVKTREFNTFC